MAVTVSYRGSLADIDCLQAELVATRAHAVTPLDAYEDVARADRTALKGTP